MQVKRDQDATIVRFSATEVASVIEGRALPPLRARTSANAAVAPAAEPSRKQPAAVPGGLVAEPS